MMSLTSNQAQRTIHGKIWIKTVDSGLPFAISFCLHKME